MSERERGKCLEFFLIPAVIVFKYIFSDFDMVSNMFM